MRPSILLVAATVLLAGVSGSFACEMPAIGNLEGLRLAKPVEGRPGAGFGEREHPVLRIVRPHHGVDFLAPIGAAVSMALPGRVVEARYSGEYGNRVVVEHGQGVTSIYSHLSRFSAVLRDGACLGMGEVIGFVGNTGLAADPHLHFELRVKGLAVDPAPLLGIVPER